MKSNYFLLILLIGVILLTGCVQTQKTTNAESKQQQEPIVKEFKTTETKTEESKSETKADGKFKKFVVEGSEFKFSPTEITVNEGDKVKVTFKNIGNVSHNFVISGLGVSTKITPPDSSDSVEFIANKSGTFSFYCSVGNHRQAGMEGNISIN